MSDFMFNAFVIPSQGLCLKQSAASHLVSRLVTVRLFAGERTSSAAGRYGYLGTWIAGCLGSQAAYSLGTHL